MWLNVAAVDYRPLGGGSNSMWWNLTYAQVDEVCKWQCGRLTEELQKLAPTAVFFGSGPNYDYYLAKEFKGFRNDEKFDDFKGLRLVRLRDEDGILPPETYRFYHPGYINRRRKWDDLVIFVRSIVKIEPN